MYWPYRIMSVGEMSLPKQIVQTRVMENSLLNPLVRHLKVYSPDIARDARPGQFVHIRINEGYEPLLRRPLSIANTDAEAGVVSIIYRIVGRGTALLAQIEAGKTIDCMGPLGNGFSLKGERPLLLGGGMGLAPLVFLANSLCPKPMQVIMGGRTIEEMFWPDIFAAVCENIHITTDDGTLGQRGVALDLLPDILKSCNIDMIYTCGPRPMLKGAAELAKAYGIPCQFSLEEYMACGFGACLSCTCAAADGKRLKVCSDGPVFWAGEVMP